MEQEKLTVSIAEQQNEIQREEPSDSVERKHPTFSRTDGHPLAADTEAALVKASTVSAVEDSLGRGKMQRWPCTHRLASSIATTEKGVSHKQKPQRRMQRRASLQARVPRSGALMPATRSHTRFIHCRGQPTRTHANSKRAKRSRVRRCHTQVPGWTHERQMRSSVKEGLQPQLKQLDQDADLLKEEAAIKPTVAPLEELLLEGDKLPPNPRQGPFFYIGGTNGASIISNYCESKGWRRTKDSRRKDYKLKWCEIKCRDNYYSFQEGQQLLFQLPNNKLLTTKIGLLSALREHARILSKSKLLSSAQPRFGKDIAPALEELLWTNPGRLGSQRILKMEDFFPETYRLDIKDERQAFFSLFDETQIWICKPTASNQGKGIFLIRSRDEVTSLKVKTQSMEDDPIYCKTSFRAPQARVVQRYIQNPLLLDGKKFDVRSYLLIACAMPYMVFFGHGYARLTLSLYNPHSSDLSSHLTNQFMQKKSPLYMLLKESTVWSMEHLNHYINDNFRKTRGLPRDWVFTIFTKRMQQIMAHCFLAVKSKLEGKLGYFDLIGCDFLIDEDFKVWLLEMNSNPALHTNCEVLKEVIPGVVMETLDLALETFQKSLCGQKMLPLLSQRRFVLLYNGEADLGPRVKGSRSLSRPPPPKPACDAASWAPGPPRAVERPDARRSAPPRAAPGPSPYASRRARTPGSGGASSAEPSGSPCPGSRTGGRDGARGSTPLLPPEKEHKEKPKSASHRGS